jgi:hypothetical protein
MTTTAPLPAPRQSARRAAPGARRFGYLIGAGVNAALLWLALVEPGWRAAPFITEEAAAVLGLVIIAWLAGLAVNLVYLVWDPPGLKRLGDAVTGALTCAIAVQLLQVFPFDVSSSWETLLRILLVFTAVGAAISVVVNLVQLVVRPWGDTA